MAPCTAKIIILSPSPSCRRKHASWTTTMTEVQMYNTRTYNMPVRWNNKCYQKRREEGVRVVLYTLQVYRVAVGPDSTVCTGLNRISFRKILLKFSSITSVRRSRYFFNYQSKSAVTSSPLSYYIRFSS